MNDSKKLLKSILGEQGYETLEKAIYKQKTQAVVDPLEFYLPLIVVPRTIISWLVQNIKPMKPGDILDTKFPGRDDIAIHFEKQAPDQYRAEFVQGGKIIHTFEKQALPSVSGHLMTVGELYDSFGEQVPVDPIIVEAKADPKLNEPKSEGPQTPQPGFEALRQIISMSNCAPSEDPENIKWQMSHANVREMTSVIGKLVDALTAKQMSRDRLENDLDKVAEKEVKDQQGKISEGKSAEQVGKDHNKDLKSNPDIKTPGMSQIELEKLKAKTTTENAIDLKPKVAPESKDRADKPSGEKPFKKDNMPATPTPTPRQMTEGERVTDKPRAEKPFAKESMAPSMQAARNISSPRMAGAEQDQAKQKGIQARISPDKTKYFRKKMEILSKPYVSDAQRRLFHAKENRGEISHATVAHWDAASKGKDLPEHVKKDDKQISSHTSPSGAGGTTNAKKPAGNVMAFPVLAAEKPMDKADKPMGAGQPVGPAKPIAPKAPVPPSNAPAQSAAKQAQAQASASGTGGYKPPHTPGAKQPKNPTVQKCGDYFRSKLGKSEPVKSNATEEQLYKSQCPTCGVPEFKKGADGHPHFNPCACFLVMKKDAEGKPYKFVQVLKKADGNFSLAFAKDADPEVVKLFLLTLKSALLIKRKFGVL